MAEMGRVQTFGVLVAASVLAAGLFGAAHNQLSYSVGSTYFHDFKFAQFAIGEDMQNRLGAAVVGWRASWWMGLIIGIPTMLYGFFWILRPSNYLAAGFGAIGSVLIVTLMATLLGLMTGMLGQNAPFASDIVIPQRVTDTGGFLRAAFMHNASYFGGLFGLIAAFLTIWRVGSIERRMLRDRKEIA